MALLFNEQSVVSSNSTATSTPETSVRITEAILNEIKDDSGDEIFYVSTNTETNALYLLLKELYDLSPDLVKDDGEYKVATYAGVSIIAGSLSYSRLNRNLERLTYYLAFRSPFKKVKVINDNNQTINKSHPDKFSSWYEKSNELRVIDWTKKYNNPSLISLYGAIVHRLTKNGEPEVWVDSGSYPNSATSPQIKFHLNNTKYKYDYFGIVLHRQIESVFFVNNVSQVRIPYYLKSEIEAPFLSHWIKFSRSFPYNVTSNNGIPHPTDGYTKIVISNIRYLNSSNQLVNSDFFSPTYLIRPANYSQFPVIESVVSGNPLGILNGKLKINAYKKTRIEISINTSIAKKNFNNKQISIKETGSIVSSVNNLPIMNQSGLNNYNPDIFSALDFKDLKTYYDQSTDSLYIHEFEPIILYADFVLSGTVQNSDLIGHRIYNIANEYSVLIPNQSTAISDYVDKPEVSGTRFIVGQSGITIGIGIDAGNSFDASQNKPNPDRRSYFEDTILANNCPNWASMSESDKNIIRSIYGIKETNALNIWLRNITLFNKLNLQINDSSFYNLLKDCAGFGERFYYNKAISQLNSKGLKTSLNVIEEYVILTLMYNNESTINKNATNFVEAINTHSYSKLLSTVESVTNNFSQSKVAAKLKSSSFKRYYNDFHFHNLTL